jgi:23S rRNA pseudouridine955/2504/2580 synthase
MEITLMTGRTHQIRVHAAASGHPVAGDEKYGAADFNRAMRKQGLRRLFLHAYSLNFRRPDNSEHVRFEAPLDEDLERVLANLQAQRP